MASEGKFYTGDFVLLKFILTTLLAINYRLTGFKFGRPALKWALKWAGQLIFGPAVYNPAVTYIYYIENLGH